MQSIRCGLRLWVATWLIVQVASLSALVPRDCCAAHRAATKARPACHQAPAVAVTHCPMPARSGTACPMHGGHDAATADRSGDGCAMRGSCKGPMAALFTLLSNYGPLTVPFQLQPDVYARSAPVRAGETLVTLLVPPDSPPPRA